MVGGSMDFDGEITIEIDLQGSHQVVRVDVTPLNSKFIELPRRFLQTIFERLTIMGAIKVQFGISTEWRKENESKICIFSNRAELLTETFIQEGVEKLNVKMEAMTQLGSDWKLIKITEIFFILSRISNLSRLSGSGFIETPQGL